MKKISIPYPIIVEGKYDKIKLSSLFDADIFTTEGFGIFKSSEKAVLFKRLAEKSGKIIVLTDSDGGGSVIRSYIKSFIPKDKIINLYVPAVSGKEKRKEKPSKEGFLGVEGTESEILLDIFSKFTSADKVKKGGISKALFYQYGLTGKTYSSAKRAALAKELGFPSKITSNALISALNILYTQDEFKELCEGLF